MKYTENAYYENISSQAEDFIEITKLNSYDISHLGFISQANEELITKSEQHTIELGNTEFIALVEEFDFDDQLYALSRLRKSDRSFNSRPLTFKHISQLLLKSYFVTAGHRVNIPSAGSLNPNNFSLIVRHSEGLSTGMYLYDYQRRGLHCLNKISLDELDKMLQLCFYSNMRNDINISEVSVIGIISVTLNRNTIKYRDRGIRFSFIESGCLLQSFYLNSTQLTIKCCAIGGFIEDNLLKYLGYNKSSELITICIAFG